MTKTENSDKAEFPADLAERIEKEITDFPADYYSEIGKIVAAWSFLERLIDRTYAGMKLTVGDLSSFTK